MVPRTCNLIRWFLVLLCATGAVISGALVKEHAGPWASSKAGPTLLGRLCGSGPDGDSGCAAVLQSDWSAIDFDVPLVTRALAIRWYRVVMPVAFIGLGYFVFVGVWFAFAGPPRPWGRWWYLVPLMTVSGGAAGSVALLWILLFKLESQCSWCLVIHGINAVLLVGTLCLWPRKGVLEGERSKVRSLDSPALYARATLTPSSALTVMGFALVVIIGLWVVRGAKLDIRQEVAKLVPYKQFVDELKENPAFLLREYYAKPQFDIPKRTAKGVPEGRALDPTLVIFSDFQCPSCACFRRTLEKEYRSHWDGSLRVSLRHFPLNRACNDTVTKAGHAQACRAAYAAEAARLQGGDEAFWQMHDLLFAHQLAAGRPDPKRYATLAAKIGLDGEQLLEDMTGEQVRQAIASDVALAAELGVTQTPSVFLNGRRVPQLCLYNPVFWRAIAQHLPRSAGVAGVRQAATGVGSDAGHAEPVASAKKVAP